MAVQEAEYRIEREAVLLAERDDNPVVGRRGLQFKIEGYTKPLPQGEAPGTVDPASEWRVQDQLHPAAFIEEPLRHNRLLRRHGSKYCHSVGNVGESLFRRTLIQSAVVLEPTFS
jgi:hypothetical protein